MLFWSTSTVIYWLQRTCNASLFIYVFVCPPCHLSMGGLTQHKLSILTFKYVTPQSIFKPRGPSLSVKSAGDVTVPLRFIHKRVMRLEVLSTGSCPHFWAGLALRLRSCHGIRESLPRHQRKPCGREYVDSISVGHFVEIRKHTFKWSFPFLLFHSPYSLTPSCKNVTNYLHPSSYLRLCSQAKSNEDRWHENMVFIHLSSLQSQYLFQEMAAHSSILAWKIPWIEEPGGVAKSQQWLSGRAHTHIH